MWGDDDDKQEDDPDRRESDEPGERLDGAPLEDEIRGMEADGKDDQKGKDDGKVRRLLSLTF